MSDYDLIVLDLDSVPEMLEACLASIAGQSVAPRRVVVLDNGSRVATRERLPHLPSSIDLERVETNLGFAGGVNRALQRSTSPLVGLVNSDVTLDREWAKVLQRVIVSDERCAGVQAIVLSPGAAVVDGAGIAFEEGRIVQLGHGSALGGFDAGRFWGVSATAALYRRAALDAIAGDGRVFDERFFAYYEDVDVAARLISASWVMRLIEQPLAQHRGSASAARLGFHAEFLRTRNRYWIARKHKIGVRRSALLSEDLRRSVKALLAFRFRQLVAIVRGATSGLFLPL